MNSKLAQQPASESDRRSDEQLIGSVLSGRYRVDSLLGSGATGRVYAAEHVMMQKRVALKILHHELSSVPELIARFEREATAAASIEHPNVVSATDFGKLDNGDLFLVLELVQGTSLRDEIVKGPFRVERAVNIASQIASGLAAAHALGIVHRDLKPENIMLVTRGGNADFVKILDFGIAKMAVGSGGTAEPLTRIGVVFGTPEYMAPEQALGQPADARSDIYSLGVLIYEMLSGLRPFQSEGQATIIAQQLAQPPIPLSERVPTLGIPPALEALVSKLLARDASERYQSAAELADELKALTRAGVGGQYFTLLNGSPPNVVTTENAAPQEIARAEYKPTFLPSDPLPSFTFPPLDDDAQILTKASEQARAIAEQLAEPTTAEAPQRSRTELGRSGATVPVSATGSQLEIASASKPDSRGTRVHDAIRRGRELFQKI